MSFSAPVLLLISTFLFSCMAVCVKLASADYNVGEIVMYRGLIGALLMMLLAHGKQVSLRTPVPSMHLWRCVATVSALFLWFYSLGGLPLSTGVTLNYMSSVWIAVFLIGGSIVMGQARVDGRLVATVMAGFIGVILILRPTLEHDQLWHGLMALISGMCGALALLQVTALGRAGEPETRVVFYMSLAAGLAGLLGALLMGGLHFHNWRSGLAVLGVAVTATVGQVLMTVAFTKGRPLVNATMQYMAIVYSFILGVLIFDDPVSWMAVLGMLMIVGSGLAATMLRQGGPAKDAKLETEV